MAKAVRSFWAKFTVLRGAVRELWGVFTLKAVEIVAYGVISPTLVLWLSSDLGYGDAKAGYMIAVFSTMLSLFTVLVGSLTDAMGTRRTLLMGFIVCLFARVLLTFSTSLWIVLPNFIILLSLGFALMTPVMTAAIKNYTTVEQRSIAYSLYYVLMNVGFAIAGWIFDRVRKGLGEYGKYDVPVLGITLSTYRTLFLISIFATVVGLVITWLFIREGVVVTEDGVKVTKTQRTKTKANFFVALVKTIQETLLKTWTIFASLWKQPAFYKFMVFLTFVTAVRLIFYHTHFTFPKFVIRELGEGAPIGKLYAMLNPILIIILVPIVGALTQKISAYKMISVGTVISTLGVFFMAVPQHWFAGLAAGPVGDLIGHSYLGMSGPVSPWVISISAFVVFLSIGEAIWSPRVFEYSAAIAPKGQEASYLALSILPLFLAKLAVGGLSGVLLQNFCPAQGERSSTTLWLIIGLITTLGPVGLFAFRKYIQVHEEGRKD